MSEIEINKEELSSAISVFRNAISAFETAKGDFATAAGSIESQSSNFVNQMKVWLEYISEESSKELIEGLTTYADAVQAVVDGFTASDEELARSLQNGEQIYGNSLPNSSLPSSSLQNNYGQGYGTHGLY